MTLCTGPAPTPTAPVRFAEKAWLTAIAAGAAEALVRLALPDPPTAADLGVRFAPVAAFRPAANSFFRAGGAAS